MITLRDYQQAAVDRIRFSFASGRRAPLYQLSTGGGKTVIFAHIAAASLARGKRVWVLVHRAEILTQTSRALAGLGVPHGRIASGARHSHDSVQIASVQTLARRLGKIETGPDLIIVDECFPAGTLVSGVPIERVRPGDAVESYDEKAGRLVSRKVARVMRSRPKQMCKVRLYGRHPLAATMGHPIFTKNGWRQAGRLSSGDMVLCAMEDCGGDYNFGTLRDMRSRDIEAAAQNAVIGQPVLLARLLRRIFAPGFFCNHGENEPDICLGKDEAQQSDDERIREREAKNLLAGDGVAPAYPGRQWKARAGRATFDGVCTWVANGIGCLYRNAKRLWLSSLLQNRRGEFCAQNCDRGRRFFSCVPESQGTRPEKRKILEWVRVEGVEILEQTSDGTFGGMCPDGFVYNLEIECTHTYTAAGVVVHNCHHATAGQWRKILGAYSAARVLGVTATPARMDGQGLGVSAGGFFDDLILGPSTAELTAAGYLCPAEIYAPSSPDLSGVRRVQSDFDRGELAGRMDKSSITGDAVTHYRKLADGLPAIAFCVSVAHARHVAEQFQAAGYRAACLDGGTDDATRKRLIDGLGTGAVQVLTSCEIVSEGTDVPIVAAAILLRPTQSEGLYLQQVGRVLRPYPGKKTALILDHAGNCLRHGMPDDDRIWTLEGRKRKARKNEDPEALSVRQCPACFRVYQAFLRKCPGCGAEPVARERKLEERPGDLVKVEKARLERERRAEVARCKSFEDLQILARSKGYKPGWAKHVWEARERKASKW